MSEPRGYEVRLKASAERELDGLPRPIFDRIVSALVRLESNPPPRGTKKLLGTAEFRIRVGSYRVLYTVDDHHRLVEIIAVGHRKDVYR
jgi:mRNA interferase RelE/StbE